MPLPFFQSARKSKPAKPREPEATTPGRLRSSGSALSTSQEPLRKPMAKSTFSRANSLTSMLRPTARQPSPATHHLFMATSQKLGSGAYGSVVLGNECLTGDPVAIKFIPDGRMKTSSLEREVELLRRLSKVSNPSLMRFYGHIRPADARAGAIGVQGTLPLNKPLDQCHALVMEAARGGELFDYVVEKDGLGEPEAQTIFAQLCDAVHAAHSIGIAHRDLKLENVLRVAPAAGKGAGSSRASLRTSSRSSLGGAEAAGDASIKLIDWGLAHPHELDAHGRIKPERLHSRCGSRSYMAPEVTNRDISGGVGYDGFAADVWSLGVCLFAVHFSFFPFEQAHPLNDWRAREVVDAQSRGKSTVRTILAFYPQKPLTLSEDLIALIDSMLLFDPTRRATLEQVLASAWLAPSLAALRARLPGVLLSARLSTLTASDRSHSTFSSASANEEGHAAERHAAAERAERSSVAARQSAAEPQGSSAVARKSVWGEPPLESLRQRTDTASMPPSVPPSMPPSMPPSPTLAPRGTVSPPEATLASADESAPPPEAPLEGGALAAEQAPPPPSRHPSRYTPADDDVATVEIVLAGGRVAGGRTRGLLAQASLKTHSQHSIKSHSYRGSDVDFDAESQAQLASSRSATSYLAALFAKASRASRNSSPHRHARVRGFVTATSPAALQAAEAV